MNSITRAGVVVLQMAIVYRGVTSVVCGGTGGIGHAICCMLAGGGANVHGERCG